ncbi:MAG: hypothetical protein GXO74_00185 [Calditrichaeota bacterium]|nr:hypothetical protein [Calditrichota bacterium]
MKKKNLLSVLLTFLFFIFACNVNLNKSITIEDGQTVNHSLNVVNGIVRVGNNCVIKGGIRSVNGSVLIGSHTKAQDVKIVNGKIVVGDSSFFDGSLEVVNGEISCGVGTKIHGSVKTVNGGIDLTGVRIRRDVGTVNGDIVLTKASVVEGNIIIKKAKGKFSERQCTIRIADNSEVMGNIIVEDERVQVTVHLQSGGKVLGKVENAKVLSD